MFKPYDRVFETSVTTGAGEYTLAGAQTGFQPFSVVGANNTAPYFATDDVNWEAGIGTYLAAPSRLQRTTILASSNGGAAVNWGDGTRKIRCGLPAALAAPRALAKSVAGGAGDTVLTADEQRRDILIFTGALTGNRTISVDDTPWNWIVYNNTTGAFSLTVKTTAGTGIAVTQGKRAVLYGDGVNVQRAFDDPAVSEFAAGTRVSGFQQTTAPIGWAKETNAVYNDAAMRIVTGTVGTGGADAFSTHFGTSKSTAGFTLAIAEMPAHTHSTQQTVGVGGGVKDLAAGAANVVVVTGSTGGGGSHAHVLNSFDIKFVDSIIAQKD